MAPDVTMILPYDGSNVKQRDLPSRVAQLVIQKGTFRDVSEAKLRSEIEGSQQDGDLDEKSSVVEDGSDKDEDPETIRNNLFKERFEGIQRLGMMAHGLQTFIDTLSLSLAANSKLAANSISARVKDAIPVNSMQSYQVEPKEMSTQAQRRAADMSNAATSEAFTNAAKRLQAASDRLKQESDRQAKYWAELARLRSANWPVSRLPSNSTTIVVHYGSLESNEEYKSRGLALLSQDENGSMSFRGQTMSHRNMVVRILRDGEVTGLYSARKDFSIYSSLEADLMRAREFLFQDELFTEVSKEARTISNMGVICRSNSINAAISHSLSFEVLYTDDTIPDDRQPQADDSLAAFILGQLRTMLIAEHKHKHVQRTHHQPSPISQNSRSISEYAMLRPVVAQLRHKVKMEPVLTMLDSYQKSCERVGLQFGVEHNTGNNESHENVSLTDLRLPVRSTIKVKFPSGSGHDLTAETLLAAPRFGTQWLASTLSTKEYGTTTFPLTSSDDDVRSSFEKALTRDLCVFIHSNAPNGTMISLFNIQPLEMVMTRKEEQLAAILVACHDGKIGISIANLKDKSKEILSCDEYGIKTARNGTVQKPDTGTFVKHLKDVLDRCCD